MISGFGFDSFDRLGTNQFTCQVYIVPMNKTSTYQYRSYVKVFGVNSFSRLHWSFWLRMALILIDGLITVWYLYFFLSKWESNVHVIDGAFEQSSRNWRGGGFRDRNWYFSKIHENPSECKFLWFYTCHPSRTSIVRPMGALRYSLQPISVELLSWRWSHDLVFAEYLDRSWSERKTYVVRPNDP